MNGPNGSTIGWRFWIGPGLVSALLLWGLYSLNTRMDRMETRIGDRIEKIETELSDQGKALARIEGRLDPYPTPGSVNGG